MNTQTTSALPATLTNDQQLARIMRDFPFEETQAFMKANNRVWGTLFEGVPNVENIKAMAVTLVTEVMDNPAIDHSAMYGDLIAYKSAAWGIKLAYEPFRTPFIQGLQQDAEAMAQVM